MKPLTRNTGKATSLQIQRKRQQKSYYTEKVPAKTLKNTPKDSTKLQKTSPKNSQQNFKKHPSQNTQQNNQKHHQKHTHKKKLNKAPKTQKNLWKPRLLCSTLSTLLGVGGAIQNEAGQQTIQLQGHPLFFLFVSFRDVIHMFLKLFFLFVCCVSDLFVMSDFFLSVAGASFWWSSLGLASFFLREQPLGFLDVVAGSMSKSRQRHHYKTNSQRSL